MSPGINLDFVAKKKYMCQSLRSNSLAKYGYYVVNITEYTRVCSAEASEI
jgi:hypothetical protein